MSDFMPAARPALAGPSRSRPEPLTGSVIAVDLSGSMASIDDGSQLSRRDRGTLVLRDVFSAFPGSRLVVFGDVVREVIGFKGPTLELPQAGGSTPLHRALELIGAIRPRPVRIVCITDGHVDDPAATLTVARSLKPSIIDCLFVGADGDTRALSFLKTLSLMGGRPGVSGLRDLTDTPALANEIKALLLTGPAR